MRAAIIAFLLYFIPLTARADPFSLLIEPKSRDIYLQGKIDDELAQSISRQLTDLDKDSHKEIVMHITSYGGEVMPGLQIYDAMKGVLSPVHTICQGYCMSMAALILASGDKREADPSARIMVHGVALDMVGGKLPELANQLSEAYRLQDIMDSILVKQTGRNLGDIKTMEAWDHFLSPPEAVQYGIIDNVKLPLKRR